VLLWKEGLRDCRKGSTHAARKSPRTSAKAIFSWLNAAEHFRKIDKYVHLRIKRFFGTSENAVKTQVWIAVAVYVLAAIIRKRLDLTFSLHSMLQILSVTPFEKAPLIQLITGSAQAEEMASNANQLNLF
jgi:hypothetical protein